MIDIRPIAQSLRTRKEPFVQQLAEALDSIQTAIDRLSVKVTQTATKLDAPAPSRLIPAAVPGIEFADLIRNFSVRVEQRLEGGTWKTYLYPTFDWPDDPNCAGVEIQVYRLSGVLLDDEAFGRQLKADDSTPSNWFDCPSALEMVKVRALSFSAPDSTTAVGGRTNSYVLGVTPEVQVQIGRTGGVLDLAKATPQSLSSAAFASTIEPVGIVNEVPDVNGQLAISETTSAVYNQYDRKLYRWDWAIGKYRRKAGLGDYEMDSVTVGVVAAGAIRTRELAVEEILVGPGGGKPPRFAVKDISGNLVAFIGSNDMGDRFNWFRDVRVGPDINNPTILGDASGVRINGAMFTLNLNGLTTKIANEIDGVVGGIAGLSLTLGADSRKTTLYGDAILMNNASGVRTVQIYCNEGSAPGGAGYSHIMLRGTDGNNKISLDSGNGGALSIQGNMRVSIIGFHDFYGVQVLTDRQPAVGNPAGGTVVDAECRAALTTLLSRLRMHGLIAT